MIQMCTEILDISESAYKIVLKYIPVLPSIEYIQKLKKEKYLNFSVCLLNLDKLSEMLIQYKIENGIVGQNKIHCTLAVDALYFRPDIKIGPKGVQGFSKDIELKKLILINLPMILIFSCHLSKLIGKI